MPPSRADILQFEDNQRRNPPVENSEIDFSYETFVQQEPKYNAFWSVAATLAVVVCVWMVIITGVVWAWEAWSR
jgi:hypothetical protein